MTYERLFSYAARAWLPPSASCAGDLFLLVKLFQPETLQFLAERIRELESRPRIQGRPAVPVGLAPLEDLLPERQLPAGSLVELVSLREGDGAGTLALWLARQACADGKAVVIADGDGTFYPPGAAALAGDWAACLLVRPPTLREAYLAADLALRCPAVGAVVARCGNLSVPVARRLQAAAEIGGGLGLVLRSAAALGTPAFATLRLVVQPLESAAEVRRLKIEVTHCRGGAAGQSFFLEVDHASGDVRVPAGVAAPAAGPRAAGTAR